MIVVILLLIVIAQALSLASLIWTRKAPLRPKRPTLPFFPTSYDTHRLILRDDGGTIRHEANIHAAVVPIRFEYGGVMYHHIRDLTDHTHLFQSLPGTVGHA